MNTAERAGLIRRGLALERMTLAWNVVGVMVLGWSAISARSVALAGFGLDSLIEIGASAVVLWELSGAEASRQQRGLRLIGGAFVALAVYITVQGTVVLTGRHQARHSVTGILWTGATVAVMLALARGKSATGQALGDRVLQTEARVTLIDALLAGAVLVGLVLNALAGAWWADPLAGFVIVFYGLREANDIFRSPLREPLDQVGDAERHGQHTEEGPQSPLR